MPLGQDWTMSLLYTLPFDRATPADEVHLGGKCASLARLIRSGAPVPPGFAITVAGWRAMLAQQGLGEEVAAIVSGLERDPAGDVMAQEIAARRIAAAFATRALPQAMADAIAFDYRALCRIAGAVEGDLPVAVRSSATAEDLADASFAGQLDTCLWVVGLPAVLEAVRRCWASLYTARAIAYRNDRHIAHAEVEMAVGVQQMVDARSAGVAMTLDPLNGDRSRIVIDAAWGLGEGVVSGEITPDHFVVDKVLRSIVGRRIGPKLHEVVADAGNRCTVQRAVPAERQGLPSLSDQQILAVAALARQLEKQFGAPQDVEWAIEHHPAHPEGRLLLLQCRPETVWSQRKPAAPAAAATGLQGLVSSLLTPVRIHH